MGMEGRRQEVLPACKGPARSSGACSISLLRKALSAQGRVSVHSVGSMPFCMGGGPWQGMVCLLQEALKGGWKGSTVSGPYYTHRTAIHQQQARRGDGREDDIHAT